MDSNAVKDVQTDFPGTIFPSHQQNDNYSLLQLLRKATDLSVLSEELERLSTVSAYYDHLSVTRTNLLRPFEEDFKNKSVLEVGTQCGALTRYLGECGAIVTALESDFINAAIATERCHDLPNVTVYNEPVTSYHAKQLFDFIVMTGDETVVQQNNIYLSGIEIYRQAIKKCGSLLKPEGQLIIAVDNRLALPQEPLTDIEEKPTPLFTKNKLHDLLNAAGLGCCEWFFPFPGYRHPAVILHEKSLETPDFGAAAIITQGLFHNTATEKLIGKMIQPLLNEKLMSTMANAFLVVAGRMPLNNEQDRRLAYSFSNGRKYKYRKNNIFTRTTTGIQVEKKQWLHPAPGALSNLQQQITDEDYLTGKLYAEKLNTILSTPGWTNEQALAWALPYYRYLNNISYVENGKKLLAGKWIDATPFNLIEDNKHVLTAIDQEWITTDALPLHYVFFRGVYHTLLRTGTIATAFNSKPLTAFEFIETMLHNFIRQQDDFAAMFVVLENKYFSSVAESPAGVTDFILIEPNNTQTPSIFKILQQIQMQVFVETVFNSFCETHSTTHSIDLHDNKTMYSISIPFYGSEPVRVRIDPAVSDGLVHLHSITLLQNTNCLFKWTVASGSNMELVDCFLFGVAAGECPVLLLLSADPMLIIDLPTGLAAPAAAAMELQIELSAVTAGEQQALQTTIQKINQSIIPGSIA